MIMTQRRLMITIVCLLTMLAGGVCILAQDSPQPPSRHHGFSAAGAQDHGPRGPFPPDSTFNFVGSEMRFGGKTVTGAPYSATAVTESVQVLRDGNRITHSTSSNVYRDSQGRTRVEQTVGAIGPFAASSDAPKRTYIHDPVAGAQYVLDASTRTAQKMKTWSGNRPEHHPPSSSDAKTESLGAQTIEGVQAEGTRTTITIPAGKFGNDQPMQIVHETWYSPELQVVILSKHTDPRMGEHTYRLTTINRSEPAKSLFDVPADYSVREGSFNRGPGMRGPKQLNDN